jgi:Ca2+-binding EF-hand superfamily protein
MTTSTGLVGLAVAFCLGLATIDDSAAAPPTSAAFDALGDDAVQDLILLGETRPILLRLRVMIGERPFRATWSEGLRAYHSLLDINGDGRVSTEEAEKGGLPALLNRPGQSPQGQARAPMGVDVRPKDGVISIEELTEALRPGFGPFRLDVEANAGRRTDALFDQLDRDKDGELIRSEMELIVGSLRRLDRDADELIDVGEVNPLDRPNASMMMQARPARDTSTPTVLATGPDESLVRLARLLIKKYDTGSSRGPGRRDLRLSPEEFAIPEVAFAAADRNHDGTLNAEELRGYLAQAPRDAVLDIALAPDAGGKTAAVVRGSGGGPPSGMAFRPFSDGLVEIDVGSIRLDIHIDDGAGRAESARKGFHSLFDLADANEDGYLEMEELSSDVGRPSPLAGLFKALDRDGDGKLYPRELDEFVAREAVAARGRLTMTAADEGRALFGMLDLDRDRHLGAREVLETFARVSACDRDHDGRVTPDEIPHHFRLILDRGDLSRLLAPPVSDGAVAVDPAVAAAMPRPRPTADPGWFRKMDRNHDGDVSAREFLGTRQQFDRLDHDHDGLLSSGEAEKAAGRRPAPVTAPGD